MSRWALIVWAVFMVLVLLFAICPDLALAQNASFAKPAAVERKFKRSQKEARLFRVKNPCPKTGLTTGPCENFRIDHIIPLCAGGSDNHTTNMQWQSLERSRQKDKIEIAYCRCMARELLACR